MTSVQRKCNNCGHWNKDDDYCLACGNPISLAVLAQIKRKKEQKKEDKEDKFDLLIKRMKNSSNFIVKGTYYLLYSIWTAFFIILTFCLWLVAASPG